MKAITAYILELKYWSDLSILGYFWILLKPYAFYLTTYFIVSLNGYEVDKNLLHSLEWTIYWFSALNCVQSCKRLRKFVVHGAFGTSDLFLYAVIDLVFNLLILLIPFILLSGGLNGDLAVEIFLVLLFYCISIPLFLYIGVLSINASDFSNTFNYAPMIFIGLISQGWVANAYIFSPFLAMSGKAYNLNHAIVTVLIIFAVAPVALRFLRNKLHVLYSEAIV